MDWIGVSLHNQHFKCDKNITVLTPEFLLKIWWALDGYSNRRIGIQVKRDIKLLSKILQFLNNTVPSLGTVSWPRVPKSMPRTLLTFLGKQKTGFKNLGGVGGLFLFVSKLKKVIFLIYVFILILL